MPILSCLVRSCAPLPALAVRATLVAATLVGGAVLFPGVAGAQPDPTLSPSSTTPSSTTPSTTTTTAPVPVTLTPTQVQQMSALQAQITQTGAVLDQLAETYETDSAQLGALQQHEASIRAQVADTQRKVAAARRRLRTDALIAYMGGVPLTDITAVPFSSSNEAAATNEYQQVAIANTAAVATAYESVVHTLAAQDATLLATETKVQTELTDIAKAQQSAVVAASTQQASLAMLSTGNDPSVPTFLAAQSAGAARWTPTGARHPSRPPSTQRCGRRLPRSACPMSGEERPPCRPPTRGSTARGSCNGPMARPVSPCPAPPSSNTTPSPPCPRAQAQPGDLVFWNDGTTSVQHVAIYVGAGIVLQAPSTGSVVSYSALWPVGLVGFGVPRWRQPEAHHSPGQGAATPPQRADGARLHRQPDALGQLGHDGPRPDQVVRLTLAVDQVDPVAGLVPDDADDLTLNHGDRSSSSPSCPVARGGAGRRRRP